VNSAVFSGNGRRIYSTSDDGTIRLHDAANGKELARFFSFSDGAWICLTPEGYYSASENADDRLNIRIGSRVYGMEQYRSTYNRPDLVAELLKD
jgi:WD40 repeat protein